MMRNLFTSIIWLLHKLFTRLQIEGIENIPKDRSFILTTNHLGVFDAPLGLVAIKLANLSLDRAIIVVAEKYQKSAFIRWIVKIFDFLFLDRFNPDPRALIQVYRRLSAGGFLLIAPEGTRSHTGALIEGKPGAAYLAAKSQVEIIPVGMTGTEDANTFSTLRKFRRVPIHVLVGEPYKLPPIPKYDRDRFLEAQTVEIMCKIAALLPEAYRGVYADHPRLKELLAARQD